MYCWALMAPVTRAAALPEASALDLSPKRASNHRTLPLAWLIVVWMALVIGVSPLTGVLLRNPEKVPWSFNEALASFWAMHLSHAAGWGPYSLALSTLGEPVLAGY